MVVVVLVIQHVRERELLRALSGARTMETRPRRGMAREREWAFSFRAAAHASCTRLTQNAQKESCNGRAARGRLDNLIKSSLLFATVLENRATRLTILINSSRYQFRQIEV